MEVELGILRIEMVQLDIDYGLRLGNIKLSTQQHWIDAT
jgi:hypothetical protein